jgi:hypothetical protein
MLTVHLDQQTTQGLQLLQGNRTAVDEGARTALPVETAAQDTLIPLIQFLLLQPLVDWAIVVDNEDGGDFRPFAAGPDHAVIGTLAQG